MSKIRITRGTIEGQMLYEGVVVSFWAEKTGEGLAASFEQDPTKPQFQDYDLFKALERVLYGQE